jgi:N-ethylmaleimide reductase
MSNYPHLFSPLQIGDLTLAHRIVMAPLTRLRSSQPGDIPSDLNAEYYGQRATEGGLIVTEATNISLEGKGMPGAPGIHSAAQIEGWKLVTQAVHDKGGIIFLQIWHTGRASHSSLHPEAGLPVSASALAINDGSRATNAEGQRVDFEVPRALETGELPRLIADYRQAARNAKEAGFDGVEVHSANGYLLNQFLEDSTNRRTDSYGGSIENRARLLMEVVDAVFEVWGNERVAVRLSPYVTYADMGDSNPIALYSYVLGELSKRGIAFAHVVEPRVGRASQATTLDHSLPETAKLFRKAFAGVFVTAGGYSAEDAEGAIAAGNADAVAFGRPFIANPDLVERFRTGSALNAPERTTFYGGAEKGYTDYPTIEQAGLEEAGQEQAGEEPTGAIAR